MSNSVFVHPHALKHGVSEDEILFAWSNFVKSQQRFSSHEEQCARVGYGHKTPHAIQMIGVIKPFGTLIIHAMTPPQNNVLCELGLSRRKR